MQVQRVCVLGLRPEQLGAKLLIAVYAQNSTQLPRLIVVLKCMLREHGQNASVPLADRLKRCSQLLQSRCISNCQRIDFFLISGGLGSRRFEATFQPRGISSGVRVLQDESPCAKSVIRRADRIK